MPVADARSEPPVQATVATAPVEAPAPAPEAEPRPLESQEAPEAGGPSAPSRAEAEADAAEQSPPEAAAVTTEAPSRQAEAAAEDPRLVALRAEVGELKQALEQQERHRADDLERSRSSVDDLQGRVAGLEAAELPATTGELTELRQQVSSLQAVVAELRTAVQQAAAAVDVGSTPPEVLQSAYEASLTALHAELVRTLGPGALQSVQTVMEGVRRSSSGTEFFRLEDDRFVAGGTAEAIHRGQLSRYQVQQTFDELLRRLATLVPGYRPQPLSELISSGTSAFVVATLSRISAQVDEHLAGVESEDANHIGIAQRLAALEQSLADAPESADSAVGGP